jgi:hypothetical protein
VFAGVAGGEMVKYVGASPVGVVVVGYTSACGTVEGKVGDGSMVVGCFSGWRGIFSDGGEGWRRRDGCASPLAARQQKECIEY